MSAESKAYERSLPGTGAPIYRKLDKSAAQGWRVQTPPVVTSLTETYEEVIASQGRSDNRNIIPNSD